MVRNLWRLYGGWYDGDPAHLKPPPEAELAACVSSLAGGAPGLVERAQTAADSGQLALACQLVEWAHLAAPDDDVVKKARAKIYAARAEKERSLMARGIFAAAAKD